MTNQVKSFTHKYYLFQFFGNFAFFSPVIVLFWQANGLNMAQIMLLQSIYAIGVSLLELPTGAFADIFGKKKSLFLGAFFWVVGFLWYSQSHLFWQFVIGEITAGVGAAFISGADRSYLHELLREEKSEQLFNAVEGKARGIAQVAQAMGSVFGGLIANVSLAGTLIATSLANAINAGVIITFPSVKKEYGKSDSFFARIVESVVLVRKHLALLWYVVFFATIYALIWPLQFYAQTYLQLLQIPVYLFGFIFMGINLIAAWGMTFTHRLDTFLKNKLFGVISTVVVVTLAILALFPHYFLLPLWSLFMMAVFVLQTVISGRMLLIVPFEKTATVLSLQSLLRRLIYAAIIPFLGIVTDTWGIQKGLVGYAVFMGVILAVILLTQRKSLGYMESSA